MEKSAPRECVLDGAAFGFYQPTAFQKKFNALKEGVFSKRPVLRQIIDRFGKISLYDYSKTFYEPSVKFFKERRDELISSVKSETEELLGREAAIRAARQMESFYHVSTADHLGPICHPFFLSSNFLASIIPSERRNDPQSTVIVLACSSVSLENSSFPRGILFNSSASKEVQKLPFFSTHLRPSMISHLKPYGGEEMQKVFNLLQSKTKKGEITVEEARSIEDLIREVYMKESVISSKSFSEQVTKSNYLLWKKFFSFDENFPDLIYLDLERIASRLLASHHIGRGSIIDRLIFDADDRQTLGKFEGISGAFDRKNKYGTFLFWAVPEGERYRLQLWREGDFLVSDDGRYRLPLTSSAVLKALEKKEIVPSLLLVFLLLTCYYGLKCQGGFSQVNYLSNIRDTYISIAEDMKERREADIARSAKTDEMCGDFLTAFAERTDGDFVPATGIDWFLKGGEDSWKIFMAQCKALTLEEALNPQMPEFYRILYGEKGLQDGFRDVTSKAVNFNFGVDKKIKPCLHI